MKKNLIIVFALLYNLTLVAQEVAKIDYEKLDYKKVKIGNSSSQIKKVFNKNYRFVHKTKNVDEFEFNKKILVWIYQKKIVQYRVLLEYEDVNPFMQWAERLTKYKKNEFIQTKQGEEKKFISKDGKVELIVNPICLDILYKPSINKVGEQN